MRFESLAFVGGHIPPATEISPHRPCVHCAAIRIARLASIGATSVPRGTAEWPPRVDRIRWTRGFVMRTIPESEVQAKWARNAAKSWQMFFFSNSRPWISTIIGRKKFRGKSSSIKFQEGQNGLLSPRGSWSWRSQALAIGNCRGNQSIYLHRSGPLLESGLDRPENRYGRYGFVSLSRICISTLGVDEARASLSRFSLLSLWVVVVVDVFQSRIWPLQGARVLVVGQNYVILQCVRWWCSRSSRVCCRWCRANWSSEVSCH